MTYLWQKNEDQARVGMERASGDDIPTTFGEYWDKSVAAYDYFSASNYLLNARKAVVQDYMDSVFRRTGERPIDSAFVGGQNIHNLYTDTTPEEIVDQLKPHIEKLQAKYPDLPMLSAEELDIRANQKAKKARDDYAELASRTHGWGSWLGDTAGTLYGAAKDPMNIVTMNVNPAKAYGVVARAAIGGGLVGGGQALNEYLGAEGREKIQPGYIASGEPYYNTLMATGMGAVMFAGPKALGNMWSRLRTGKWPTSIKDAGNIVMSEGQIERGNILPGSEGEIVHRRNLGTAIDQILKGDRVDVDVHPDVRRRSQFLIDELEKKYTGDVPVDAGKLKLLDEAADLRAKHTAMEDHLDTLPEPDLAKADRYDRLQQVESRLSQVSVMQRDVLKAIETTAEREQLKARQAELLKGTDRSSLQQEATLRDDRQRLEANMEATQRRLDEIKRQTETSLPHTVSFGQTLTESARFHGERERLPQRAGPREHWMTAAMSGEKRSTLAQVMHPKEVEATVKSPQFEKAQLHDVQMKVRGPEPVAPGQRFRDDKGEYTVKEVNEKKGTYTGQRKDGSTFEATGHPHEQPTLNGEPILPKSSPMRDRQFEFGRNGEGQKQTAEAALKEIENMNKAADELEGCLIPVVGEAAVGGT